MAPGLAFIGGKQLQGCLAPFAPLSGKLKMDRVLGSAYIRLENNLLALDP